MLERRKKTEVLVSVIDRYLVLLTDTSWAKMADGRWQMADWRRMFLPPPGGFKVQQVQQIHKRPCLQEISEFVEVQQKCNKVQQSATGSTHAEETREVRAGLSGS